MGIDTKTLRALATAATPGPWEIDGDDQRSIWGRGGSVLVTSAACDAAGDDAAYLVALSPDNILALLDRLEAAERALVDGVVTRARMTPLAAAALRCGLARAETGEERVKLLAAIEAYYAGRDE